VIRYFDFYVHGIFLIFAPVNNLKIKQEALDFQVRVYSNSKAQ